MSAYEIDDELNGSFLKYYTIKLNYFHNI